jgi:hypothetical protein
MKRGTVLVDVAIDQGGCFETSHATTHADPTYEVDGVIHYCVANMPGSVPLTSSYALNNATLPFGLALAERGMAAIEGRSASRRRPQRPSRQGDQQGRGGEPRPSLNSAAIGGSELSWTNDGKRPWAFPP